MTILPPDVFDPDAPTGPRLDHDAYLQRLDLLPKRCRRVAESLCLGMHQSDIAAEMGISVNTVHNHVKYAARLLELKGGRDTICAFLIWGIKRERG